MRRKQPQAQPSVGMQTDPEAISNNPLATEAELYFLSGYDATRALQHPNCPPDLWWKIAAKYPLEAVNSVLYPLLTLEEPERWAELERLCLGGWIRAKEQTLPAKMKRQFNSDCAAHVLPFFAQEHPGDLRPHHAIELARNIRRYNKNNPEHAAVYNGALQARVLPRHDTAASAAADAALYALAGPEEYGMEPYEAAELAAYNDKARISEKAAEEAEHQERLWQWHRLQEYLRGMA